MPRLKSGSEFVEHLTAGPPTNGYMERQTWCSVLRSSNLRSANELWPSPAEQEVLVPVLVVLLNRACVQQCMCSRKEKTTPFGVNLMRSPVIYWAALVCMC